jgi:hypothetical protein
MKSPAWILVVILVTVALAGCSHKSAPPPSDRQASSSPAPAALSGGQLVDFCTQNFIQSMKCFEAPGYWDVMTSIYFAKNPNMPADDASKQRWVGMLKDDMNTLARERRFEENCRAMLEHNRWPAPRTVENVTRARSRGCPEFANAFAAMLFSEGAFSQPK